MIYNYYTSIVFRAATVADDVVHDGQPRAGLRVGLMVARSAGAFRCGHGYAGV